MTPNTSLPVVQIHRRGLLVPLFLIALGAMFFAANLGYALPISARAVFGLWPVVLVVIGVEVALARRTPYLALAVEVLVIAAAVALVVTRPAGPFVTPVGSTTASVSRGAATMLSLRIDGDSGTYTVAGGATALVDARSEGGELEVRDTRSEAGDAADVHVSPAGSGGNDVVVGPAVPSTADVRVASDVPTSLRVEGTADEFIVDLREIRVRDARVEAGGSRLELTLPRPSGDVPVRIGAAGGNVIVVVPEDLEVRVTTSGVLLSTTIQNARFGSTTSGRATQSVAETPGYASAKDRVTVTIVAGVSSITIR